MPPPRKPRSGRKGQPPLEMSVAPPVGEADDLPLLGQSLRALREERGLTLEDVAELTRVRRPFLLAIEEMRLDALPSRPFTVGYIRSYAQALGMDPEAAVDRFRAEEPVLDEPLRAPVGVIEERDPRAAALVAAAIIILAAIILWNIAQRAMIASAPPPPQASEALAWKLLANLKQGPVVLGDPLPAPVESTTPPPYDPPGMAAAMGLKPNADPSKPAAETLVDLTGLSPTFRPKGVVYDSGAQQRSVVTLQALQAAALIIRGTDGSVYFARQLAAGDAYKVPALSGLTVDVSRADDFQVFVGGRSTGVLPSTQTLASKLITVPPPSAAAVAPAAPAATPPARPAAPPATPAPKAG